MNAITKNTLILSEPLSLDRNPAAVYVASLPAKTGQRTQAQALRVIAGILGTDVNRLNWGRLRYEHTQAIRARLAESYSPASANKFLSALRQTLKQAWLLGQMSHDDYGKAINLKPVTGETLPAGRGLSQGEILALMSACQNDGNKHAGIRDAAIIGLMYGAGLRRAEVVSITLDMIDFTTWEIKLTGKRQKQREIYIEGGARDALQDWLTVRGSGPGALFVAINKAGVLDISKSITSQAVYNMLEKRARDAGIQHFSPHDLRRSFISDLLDKGADISTVAQLAGHSNVQTTRRYDRRPKEARRKAAGLLHVPYKSGA